MKSWQEGHGPVKLAATGLNQISRTLRTHRKLPKKVYLLCKGSERKFCSLSHIVVLSSIELFPYLQLEPSIVHCLLFRKITLANSRSNFRNRGKMGSYCHADSAEAAPSQKGDTSGTDCVETAILQRFAIDISYLSRYICQKYLSEKSPHDKTSQKTFSHHPMN